MAEFWSAMRGTEEALAFVLRVVAVRPCGSDHCITKWKDLEFGTMVWM